MVQCDTTCRRDNQDNVNASGYCDKLGTHRSYQAIDGGSMDYAYLDAQCHAQQQPVSCFVQLQQQLARGEVDALIATTSQDNAQVLAWALQYRLAFALYQPDLVTLAALLQPLLQADFTQIGKILYLAQTDDANHSLLQKFAQQGQVMYGGDYAQACTELLENSIHWGISTD